jgi:glycosyltransferase involved in cell wall biosynthesis
MGVEVLYGDEFREGRILNWIEVNGPYIDFAFLNRPHIAEKYIGFIREHTNIACIYYGHDLHYLREAREYELTGDKKRLEESEHWKKVEFSIMHNCEAVYYPSTMEEEEIRRLDPSIPVKSVSVYSYDTFREASSIPADFNKRKGFLFVGGFAHRPNVDAMQWFVQEIYPQMWRLLGEEAGQIPFYIAGSQAPETITALNGTDGQGNPGPIQVKGFVSEEELQSLYDSCRLVVCPLRFGAGVKGKVIEAVYHGIPMITTPIGAEGIPDIRSVVAVEETAEAFARRAVEWYRDTGKLSEVSGRTQRYIREHFSMDALWNKVREDFQ